jgi:signal transduction histidine kinase
MAGKLIQIFQSLKALIFKLSSGNKQEVSYRELFTYLFLSQEIERMRTSEELDECLSLLSAPKFLLDNIEKTESNTKTLQLIDESLKAAYQKVKSATLTLQPPFAQLNKFSPILEMLCSQFCTKYDNISIRCRAEDVKEENIPNYLRIVVCRVLQKMMVRSQECFGSNNMNITLKGSLDLIFEDNVRKESLDKQKCENLTLQIESLVRLSNGSIKTTVIYPEGRIIICHWKLNKKGVKTNQKK